MLQSTCIYTAVAKAAIGSTAKFGDDLTRAQQVSLYTTSEFECVLHTSTTTLIHGGDDLMVINSTAGSNSSLLKVMMMMMMTKMKSCKKGEGEGYGMGKGCK